MQMTHSKEGTVHTLTLTLTFDEAAEYPKSSSGNSYMADTTGGFMLVQGGPAGLKVDAKLISVIPKDQRPPKT